MNSLYTSENFKTHEERQDRIYNKKGPNTDTVDIEEFEAILTNNGIVLDTSRLEGLYEFTQLLADNILDKWLEERQTTSRATKHDPTPHTKE